MDPASTVTNALGHWADTWCQAVSRQLEPGRGRDARLVRVVYEDVGVIHDRQTVALARKSMERRPTDSPEAIARGTFVSAQLPGSNEDMMLFCLAWASDAGHAGEIERARGDVPRVMDSPPVQHRSGWFAGDSHGHQPRRTPDERQNNEVRPARRSADRSLADIARAGDSPLQAAATVHPRR